MREPVVRVVDGVIDAAGTVAAEPHVERGNLEEVEERGVIGPGPQRLNRYNPTGGDRTASRVVGRLVDHACASCVEYAAAASPRIRDITGDAVKEGLERMRAAHRQPSLASAVAVDIDDCLLRQLVAVFLRPLC